VSAANRRKGHEWERELCRWLRENGVNAITSRDAHAGDQLGSDLITDLPVAVEAKNVAKHDLSGWLRQAQAQAGGKPAAVIVKRRQKTTADAFVVMQLDEWLALIRPDTAF
jgi:Holliday junction resolvase